MVNKVKVLSLVVSGVILSSFVFNTLGYDSKYVQISNTTYQGSKYNVIWMKRGESNKTIGAKYFSNETATKTVNQRFQSWADQKKIICYSSGTYMDAFKKTSSTGLIGFAIDNGEIQNPMVKKDGLDALVIVYQNDGGVICSDLSKKNLKIPAINNGAPLDLRGNDWHRQKVIAWAKNHSATIFQTHLLAMDSKLLVGSNGSPSQATRRFLAVVNDEDGNLVHAMIHDSNNSSLFKASKKIHDYLLDEKEVSKIHWMINLDTGAQDVFGLYNPDGSKNTMIKGRENIINSRNLLVYYQD